MSKFRNPGSVALAAVAALTVLAAGYQAVASDIFVSESRFVVRSAEQPEQPSLGTLFKGLGAGSAEGTHMVRDFLLSREVLADLEAHTGLRAAYRAGDWLSRFPGPLDADNTEAFFEYYLQHVKLQVDSQSSVATLTVRAFAPGTASAANERLLALAEIAVDKVNRRMRDDAVKLAQEEVARAEDRVRDAETALAKFRVSRRLLDPERQAAAQFQILAELQRSLVVVEGRLAQVRALAKKSPQVEPLETEANSLRSAIERIRTQAAGEAPPNDPRSTAYQRLALEREMAAKQLAATTEALVRARAEVARRHVYLERLAQPSHPDGSLEPRRGRAILATLLIGLLAWGVVRLVLAGVREHQEIS
jgi:capsular polysaccharide transport system permease protein